MPLDIEKALKILQPQGLLSQTIKGFEPRIQQQEMMRNILEAYNKNQIALIEAGTGTGKSFAYLIPALLWAAQQKEPTVISTHTIALQEQLLHKDIPLIAKALNIEVKAVLVKGMSNYVCLRKLEEVKDSLLLLPPEEAAQIQQMEMWSQSTRDGSRSSLPMVASSNTWERVCAEADTCTKTRCHHYQQCHFFKARKNAADAQILISNHHLLFADLTRRASTENYSDVAVLPLYSRIVLDEAHHIEDIATEYFAANVGKLTLLRLIGRLNAEKQGEALGKLPLLKKKLHELYPKNVPTEIASIFSRLTVDIPALRHDLLLSLVQVFDAFEHFSKLLKSSESAEEGETTLRLLPFHHTHPYWSSAIIPHCNQFIDLTKSYIHSLDGIEQDLSSLEIESLNEATKTIRHEITALTNRLTDHALDLFKFISEPLPNKVRWIQSQTTKSGVNINLINADLDIAQSCADYLFSKFPTITLCSATLTTNRQFRFIKERLGIIQKHLPEQAITENIYDSPFNYQKQVLLAIPTDMPPPQDPQFLNAACDKIWQAIQASHGNAFILFTSYSMLKTCYQKLEQKLNDHRYTCFKQGDGSRQSLLTKFKAQDRSILFGTDSFWEGVDVVGEALRCVIIVKLPFRVPTEPIVQARSEAISEKGGDPFTDYSLPNAIVKFKQGFGRLIRNKRDRGCVVCLDSRLLTKGYGKQFLNSLPSCQQVFAPSDIMQKQMADFYKKTYHLTLAQ